MEEGRMTEAQRLALRRQRELVGRVFVYEGNPCAGGVIMDMQWPDGRGGWNARKVLPDGWAFPTTRGNRRHAFSR